MFDAEVGVVGLGAVGSMTLRHLASRGTKVLGFEQFWVPHDRGAAGGDSRLFRSLPYLELHEGDVSILHAAIEEWKILERESNTDILLRCGGVSIGSSKTRAMQRLAEIAKKKQFGAEVLSTKEAHSRLPNHRLHDDDLVVWDHDGGLIRSELAVATAVKEARKHGAQVVGGRKVTGWRAGPGGVEIYTAHGSYRVRRLVVATGAWANELLREVPVHPRRIILTWFGPENPVDMHRFLPEQFPSFIRADGDEFLYGGPSLDGAMVKVSGVYPWKSPESADQLERSVDPQELDGIRRAVGSYFQGLSDSPLRANVYQDGWSRDDTALVGHWPGQPGVICAVGFSGYGFKICPVIGSIVADLATQGETKYAIEHMAPDRF